MKITDEVLKDRVETSFNIIPELPGRITHLDIPGVRGRVTDVPHAFTNLVSAARLDAEAVHGTIDAVLYAYGDGTQPFGWVVGPSSLPADLGSRLEARGFRKLSKLAGLVLDDFATEIRSSPDVEISEVPIKEARGLARLAIAIDPKARELISLLFEAITQDTSPVRARYYVASLDGEPVSWANMTYLPGDPIVLMGGASTLGEHRGKGIYRSLVARRIADARSDRIQAAIIQAAADTSAPICRRLGFRNIGMLDVYVHVPEAGTESVGS